MQFRCKYHTHFIFIITVSNHDFNIHLGKYGMTVLFTTFSILYFLFYPAECHKLTYTNFLLAPSLAVFYPHFRKVTARYSEGSL